VTSPFNASSMDRSKNDMALTNPTWSRHYFDFFVLALYVNRGFAVRLRPVQGSPLTQGRGFSNYDASNVHVKANRFR